MQPSYVSGKPSSTKVLGDNMMLTKSLKGQLSLLPIKYRYPWTINTPKRLYRDQFHSCGERSHSYMVAMTKARMTGDYR